MPSHVESSTRGTACLAPHRIEHCDRRNSSDGAGSEIIADSLSSIRIRSRHIGCLGGYQYTRQIEYYYSRMFRQRGLTLINIGPLSRLILHGTNTRAHNSFVNFSSVL